MTIPPDVFAAVLTAAALHAIWNAMAKGMDGDPLVASAAIAFGAAAVSLAGLVVTGLPSAASASYVVVSAIIHVAYFVLIGLAFRAADYAVIYPLYRGSAPLFTALAGWWLVGEALGPLAWTGVAVLCCGLLLLALDALRRQGLSAHAAGLAATIAAVIVAYTVVDGLGARAAGNAVAYVLAMMALNGALLLPVVLAMRGRAIIADIASRAGLALLGGCLAMLSYGTALWAMTLAPIGMVAALRETSVLFATLIAALVLQERLGPIRWLAAGIIVAGLMLLRLA